MCGCGARELRSPPTEPLCDPVGAIGQQHLDERNLDLVGEKFQSRPELGPSEILRYDDVVAVEQMGARERDSKVTCDEPRLFDLRPLTELRTDRIDVDDQRERMLLRVPLRQRRLAHSGRTVDEQQHSAMLTDEDRAVTRSV